MAVPFGTTVRLRRLGMRLRKLREDSDMTLEEAGELLERTPSSISKIETARVAVRVRDLRVILDAYGASDERQRESLLGLARDARKQGWWQRYGDILSAAYQDFISLEADATAIRTFETILIPGLLQTADYTRALYRASPGPRSCEDIDQLVAVRTERQEVLTRADPLHLWAIVCQGALYSHVGGSDTMRVQLRQLLQAAHMDNVTLQVLPFAAGAHAGVNGPFTVLEFPQFSDLDVVLVENLTSGLYLEREEEIRRYNLVFNHLRASALPEADSVALIEQVAKDL